MRDVSKKLKEIIDTFTDEQTTSKSPNLKGELLEDPDDDFVDFPYIEDPKPYITNRPLEQAPATEPTTPPPSAPTTPPPEAAAATDVGADIGAGMGAEMGAGMGMGMGMEQEEKLTSSEIGRVYELKKIYSRLASVERYLIRSTDQSILEMREYVANAINLFEIVISNFPQFKGKVDDIIVVFYEFLDVVYTSLKKYFESIKDMER